MGGMSNLRCGPRKKQSAVRGAHGLHPNSATRVGLKTQCGAKEARQKRGCPVGLHFREAQNQTKLIQAFSGPGNGYYCRKGVAERRQEGSFGVLDMLFCELDSGCSACESQASYTLMCVYFCVCVSISMKK